MKASRFDIALCEALAAQGSAGDEQACRTLVQHLWQSWVIMVRSSRSMGSLARSEDHVHNVVTRLVEKVGTPEGSLRHYPTWRDTHPDKTFADWVRIVTTNAVRDYVREQLGPRPAGAGMPSPKRLLNEFSLSTRLEELGARPPMTAAQTARELLEFARTQLSHEQCQALELWVEGSDFDDIEQELGLGAGDGRRVLRAAIAVLRRHFAGASQTPGVS